MKTFMQIILGLVIFGGCYGNGAKKTALLVIDVQKCFLTGGSLAVPNGEDVVPVINNITKLHGSKFSSYFSIDNHPPNHISFASQYIEKKPFQQVNLEYNNVGELCKPTLLRNETNRAVECNGTKRLVKQELWPDHCVQNTDEVKLTPNLMFDENRDKKIYKGENPSIDSYSAFFDNGNISQTGLHTRLQSEGINTVLVVGLATDFCVKFTSLDGVYLGYRVYLITDATRGIQQSSSEQALKDMQAKGVQLIKSSDVGNVLSSSPSSQDRMTACKTATLSTLFYLVFMCFQ